MADIYPEWIQEQLDTISHLQRARAAGSDRRYNLALAAIEARIVRYIGYRLDRLEAKIDRLLAFCESE
jgi:hypothetical protein